MCRMVFPLPSSTRFGSASDAPRGNASALVWLNAEANGTNTRFTEAEGSWTSTRWPRVARGCALEVLIPADERKANDPSCQRRPRGAPQDAKNEPTPPSYKNVNAIYTVCDPASLTCVLDPRDPHLPQQ